MTMGEHILVPLDGSARAECILPVARDLAIHLATSLILFRVIPPDTRSADELDTLRRLNDLAREFELLSPARGRVARGDPVSEIRQACDPGPGHGEVALIAMSTHGRSGISRWLLGSVAEAIVRTAPVPVVLLNNRVSGLGPSSKLGLTRAVPPLDLTRPWSERCAGLKSGPIVVPLDGSSLAESVIPIASRLARLLSQRLHLVSVVTPVPSEVSVMIGTWGGDRFAYEATRSEAETTVAAARTQLEARGHAVTGEVRMGNPGDEVLRAVNREGAGLVAMATHGRAGVARAVLGSVADHIVRQAPCPVVLVGPAAARG